MRRHNIRLPDPERETEMFLEIFRKMIWHIMSKHLPEAATAHRPPQTRASSAGGRCVCAASGNVPFYFPAGSGSLNMSAILLSIILKSNPVTCNL